MGLFDGTLGDEIEDLVAGADGESVTPDRLRNETGGLFTQPLLSDQSLIEYLATDEQPHHLLFNRSQGIERDGRSRTGSDCRESRNLLVITGDRVLLLGSNVDGDRVEAIPHTLLRGASLQTIGGYHEVTIDTSAATYSFVVGRSSADAGELQSAISFLRQHVARNRTAAGDPVNEAAGEVRIQEAADLWLDSVDERFEALTDADTE